MKKRSLCMLISIILVLITSCEVSFADTDNTGKYIRIVVDDCETISLAFSPGETINAKIVEISYNDESKITNQVTEKTDYFVLRCLSGEDGIFSIKKNKDNTYSIHAKSDINTFSTYELTDPNCIDSIKIMANSTEKSQKKAKTGIKNVNISSVTASISKCGIAISWKANDSKYTVTGYQIYRSKSKNSGYKRIETVSGNSKKKYTDDKVSIKKGTSYYYKIRGYREIFGKKIFSSYSEPIKVYCKKSITIINEEEFLNSTMLSEYDKSMLQYAYLFGLPNDIKWESGTTNEAFYNNILYASLLGDYELNFRFKKYDDAKKFLSYVSDFKNLSLSHNALLGMHLNEGRVATIEQCKDYYVVKICIANASISNKELLEQQKETIDKVLAINEDLYSKKLINDSMTDYQKMEAVYKYMSGINIGRGAPEAFTRNPEQHNGEFMKYDTAYAALINNKADCGGRAAAVAMVMNSVGLKANTMGVAYPLDSFGKPISRHVITRVKCDNESYFVDPYTSIRIISNTDYMTKSKNILINEAVSTNSFIDRIGF